MTRLTAPGRRAAGNAAADDGDLAGCRPHGVEWQLDGHDASLSDLEGGQRAVARHADGQRRVRDRSRPSGRCRLRPEAGRRLPGLVDHAGRQAGKFGHEAADIVRRRDRTFALQDRIEDAEIGRGIGAGARDPLPARRIGGASASTSVSQNQRSPAASRSADA